MAQETTWLRRLVQRWLPQAGNFVAQAVSNGATSVAVTFPRAEPDTAYGVNATPNWGTTVWVSSKTKTGCTINFGTAAGASATVDISIFRSE